MPRGQDTPVQPVRHDCTPSLGALPPSGTALTLSDSAAEGYKSTPQRIRVLTERWAHANMYCPRCGAALHRLKNNTPVADFRCSACPEEFELKSTCSRACSVIPDGAYDTMIRRLKANNNPNLFILRYDKPSLSVSDLYVIPRYFFTPGTIQKRSPLAATARRAGWVGCNILLRDIPQTGRIAFVKNGATAEKPHVLSEWRKARFLEAAASITSRSWLITTLWCIERMQRKEFTLADVYAFEEEIRQRHPRNLHIREKLRQQLQVLRDKGHLQFVARGVYRIS